MDSILQTLNTVLNSLNPHDSTHSSISLLREALFTSESVKLDRVRSSVRPSVRIIIDFYQEDMKGAETLLYLGSLNYGF